MVKITLEFPSVDAAIVGLGKLVTTSPAKPAVSKTAAADTAPPAASSAGPAALASAGEPAQGKPEKTRQRAERSDKGKLRGSYKNNAGGEGNPGQPQAASASTPAPALTAQEVKDLRDAQVNRNDDAARQAMQDARTAAPDAVVITATATATGSATIGGAPDKPIDDKTVQDSLQRVHTAKGTEFTMKWLADSYGVKRGRDLLPGQRAKFVAECAELVPVVIK